MANTEEKIILENDTFALKRQYKYAHEDLVKIKAETAEILAIRDKARADYEDKQKELTDISNKISEEKLAWATHRHAELVEIEEKQGEVQKILNKEVDLIAKEKQLKEIEARDTEIRNETRQLELKIETEKKSILALKKEVEEGKILIQKKEKEIDGKIEQFGNKVESVLTEVKSWQTK